MKSRLTRALVAATAVATLGTLAGAGQARADGRGPYDQDSEQWYAGEQRRQAALRYDAYGTGRVGGFLPSYGGYPYALPPRLLRLRRLFAAGCRAGQHGPHPGDRAGGRQGVVRQHGDAADRTGAPV